MNRGARVLDVLQDSELTFTGVYCGKPSRSIKVPTDAPVISMSVDVSPAAGCFYFPEGTLFSDRFIIWRSVGQQLFLEERSLRSTVVENCLCFSFSRSSVIPGTAISVSDGVLSIVVPTQSSIHRFYTRLIYDPVEHDARKTEVRSILAQIDDDTLLCDFHDSHLVASQGHPLRACVSQRTGATKIVYVMWEGSLVHIHMPTDSGADVEESVLRGENLLQRLVGGLSPSAVDVCALSSLPSARAEPMFYAVYRDLWVRAWNAENRTITQTVELSKVTHCEIKADDVTSILVRCTQDGPRDTMIVVGVSTSKITMFVLLRDSGVHIRKVSELYSNQSTEGCPLLDVHLTRLSNGKSWRILALWNDFAHAAGHRVQHTTVETSGGNATLMWRPVQMTNPRAAQPAPDSSADSLRRFIFNRDNHTYEVVSRAVQIVCQGRPFDAKSPNDWAGVRQFVESFVYSSESDTVQNSVNSLSPEEAKLEMLQRIARTCYELEGSSRAFNLLVLESPLCALYGVIYQNRFSLVSALDESLVSSLSKLEYGLHSRQMAHLNEMIEAALVRSVEEDEDEENGKTQREVSPPADLRQLAAVIATILDYIAVSFEGLSTVSEDLCSFGGSFISGLFSSALKRKVRAAQSSAHNLAQLCRMINRNALKKSWGPSDATRPFSALCLRASTLSREYKLLNEQLSLLFQWQDAFSSLCTWISTGDGIAVLRNEGRFRAQGDQTQDESLNLHPLNAFINSSIQASLRAVYPTNNAMMLCKMLARQKKYGPLKRILDLSLDVNESHHHELVSQSPAFHFYRAIAYSGSGKPLKATDEFQKCVEGARNGDSSLALAIAGVGEKVAKERLLALLYHQAIRTLSEHGHSLYVVGMARAAAAALREDSHCQDILERIQITLFTQQAEKGAWVDALTTIFTCKDSDSRLLILRELISRMLAQRQWEAICNLDFGELAHQVTQIIYARAVSQAATTVPNMFELLSAYHISRNDYSKAASAQYEWAVRLREEPLDVEVLRMRRDALTATATFVELLGENKFIYSHEMVEQELTDLDEEVFPTEVRCDEADDEMDLDENRSSALAPKCPSHHKEIRRRGTRRMRKRVSVVDNDMLEQEWALADARLCVLMAGGVPCQDPNAVSGHLIEMKLYDHAFALASLFGLKFDPILTAATRDAIAVDCDPQLRKSVPEWVRDNQKHVSARGNCDHWEVVRGLVRARLSVSENDSTPLHVVLTTVLRAGFPVPCWLEAIFMEVDAGGYLRELCDYRCTHDALQALARFLEPLLCQVRSGESRVLLPYAAIDQLFALAQKGNGNEIVLLSTVRERLQNLQNRMQAFSDAARFTLTTAI